MKIVLLTIVIFCVTNYGETAPASDGDQSEPQSYPLNRKSSESDDTPNYGIESRCNCDDDDDHHHHHHHRKQSKHHHGHHGHHDKHHRSHHSSKHHRDDCDSRSHASDCHDHDRDRYGNEAVYRPNNGNNNYPHHTDQDHDVNYDTNYGTRPNLNLDHQGRPINHYPNIPDNYDNVPNYGGRPNTQYRPNNNYPSEQGHYHSQPTSNNNGYNTGSGYGNNPSLNRPNNAGGNIQTYPTIPNNNNYQSQAGPNRNDYNSGPNYGNRPNVDRANNGVGNLPTGSNDYNSGSNYGPIPNNNFDGPNNNNYDSKTGGNSSPLSGGVVPSFQGGAKIPRPTQGTVPTELDSGNHSNQKLNDRTINNSSPKITDDDSEVYDVGLFARYNDDDSDYSDDEESDVETNKTPPKPNTNDKNKTQITL